MRIYEKRFFYKHIICEACGGNIGTSDGVTMCEKCQKRYILEAFPYEGFVTSRGTGWQYPVVQCNEPLIVIQEYDENKEIPVKVENLTCDELQQCIETYYCIREAEEQRMRTETTSDYPKPMPSPDEVIKILKSKSLFKNIRSGYISILV